MNSTGCGGSGRKHESIHQAQRLGPRVGGEDMLRAADVQRQNKKKRAVDTEKKSKYKKNQGEKAPQPSDSGPWYNIPEKQRFSP